MKKENLSKAIYGNKFNKEMDIELQKLLASGVINEYKKEKTFMFDDYSDEKIRMDHYFETQKKYHINGEYRSLRIAIDNTISIRNDRFRSKAYEAILLKERGYVDVVLVTTYNLNTFNLYNNPEKEKNIVKKFANATINGTVYPAIDMLNTKNNILNYIKEIIGCKKYQKINKKKYLL